PPPHAPVDLSARARSPARAAWLGTRAARFPGSSPSRSGSAGPSVGICRCVVRRSAAIRACRNTGTRARIPSRSPSVVLREAARPSVGIVALVVVAEGFAVAVLDQAGVVERRPEAVVFANVAALAG